MSMQIPRVNSSDERYPVVPVVEKKAEEQEVTYETNPIFVPNTPPVSEINISERRRILSQMIRGLVGDKFVIDAASIEKFKENTRITTEELLGELIAIGNPVAALDGIENIYLGMGLELPNPALNVLQ